MTPDPALQRLQQAAAAHAESTNGTGPEAHAERPVDYHFAAFADFARHPFPSARPLLGKPGEILLAEGSLFLVYGADGSAKSTVMIDAAAHLAAGIPWLGIGVPRPVRCLLLELEGPPGLLQEKLNHKCETWPGPDFTPNLWVYRSPWGDFTFADPHARAALNTHCEEHDIDLVMANPTLALGVGASGKPDETGQFVGWLKECGLYGSRAFWLNHHENKAGQISGDWGRHPDTKVQVQRDGNRQRTKLTWEKTRWASLDPEQITVMLDWEIETQGYTVTQLDTDRTSDDLLVERLATYLDEHPVTATTQVLNDVEGNDSRLTKLLNSRPEFDYAPGAHNAKLWTLAARSAEGPE
jgi:hypothetical protein